MVYRQFPPDPQQRRHEPLPAPPPWHRLAAQAVLGVTVAGSLLCGVGTLIRLLTS